MSKINVIVVKIKCNEQKKKIKKMMMMNICMTEVGRK